ncbi:hypothetical protein GA0115255_100142 [Streptomyces sp. Ncost-T6T-2b]|nr:hypothetical protein GA0115255_100142 [Streptomyces sp. Ncost-T6T-2b]
MYVRTPPDRAKSSVSQDLVVGFPLTFRPVTYGLSAAAPAALIVIRRSLSALSIVTLSNIGELSTRFAVPYTVGFIPRFAHTYQELSEPRSSLPGRPDGVVSYISSVARRSTSEVRCGCRSQL